MLSNGEAAEKEFAVLQLMGMKNRQFTPQLKRAVFWPGGKRSGSVSTISANHLPQNLPVIAKLSGSSPKIDS